MLAHIGYKNYVETTRVLAIIPYDSAPARRIRGDAIDEGRHIDCTQGKKTLSLIILDNWSVISSAFRSENLFDRSVSMAEAKGGG